LVTWISGEARYIKNISNNENREYRGILRYDFFAAVVIRGSMTALAIWNSIRGFHPYEGPWQS
jgi:hypothetical protein